MTTKHIKELIELRKRLHQYPEISGAERNTAQRIQAFLKLSNPSEIISSIGGNGLAAVFKYSENGPTIAIRCELDALPIAEINTFPHKSVNQNISHKCGHDGHMAIVAGLAKWLSIQDYITGKVILLFQPAEEIGKGAEKVLADRRFQNLNIDYVFALHNIPGEELHSIILTDNCFSAEVESFKITLRGIESHASEPEHGVNPSYAVAQLIEQFSELNVFDPASDKFVILTPIHTKVGDTNYGISPAHAEMHYTVRTWSSNEMKSIKRQIAKITKNISSRNILDFDIDWFEYFPASKNDSSCVALVRQAARANNLKTTNRPYAFKFGEDFGWYTKKYKTAMFGLGAGEIPALHNPDYDFPDDLIETGIKMFRTIISALLDR